MVVRVIEMPAAEPAPEQEASLQVPDVPVEPVPPPPARRPEPRMVRELLTPPVATPPPPASAEPRTPAPAAPAVVTAVRFDAAYLNNPAPRYPTLSRRRGEEGRVLLQVWVDAHGQPQQVEIHQGSGYARLDEAALEAVRRWRFIPARRGDETIAASVLVPIAFQIGS
jgi:protein TonB